MLGLKLIHISKWGPAMQGDIDISSHVIPYILVSAPVGLDFNTLWSIYRSHTVTYTLIIIGSGYGLVPSGIKS